MYLTLKLLHVLAVVLFLGNITTGLFWKAHADRSRDPRIVAHTLEGIRKSDRWFTLPGAALILVAGFAAADVGGWSVFGTPWIGWSLVLFGISGAVFGLRVAPLQRRMRDLARSCATGEDLERGGYRRLSIAWEAWGLVALLTPFAAFALMILKPEL